MRHCLAAIVACLLVVPSASATTYNAAVTSGTQNVCKFTVHKKDWPFSDHFNFDATTVCDQPVAQTGQAWLPHDWDPVYGGLCSGSFTKTCSSGGSAQGEYHEPAHYRVT